MQTKVLPEIELDPIFESDVCIKWSSRAKWC